MHNDSVWDTGLCVAMSVKDAVSRSQAGPCDSDVSRSQAGPCDSDVNA